MSAHVATSQMRQQQRIAHEPFNVLTDAPNLHAWYRADTTTNAGGFVSQWTDKSGNGFHVPQATGSKQGALNVADANMGGRDSISLDGTDDCFRLVSPGLGAMGGLTCFVVSRSIVVPGSNAQLITIGDTSNSHSVNVRISSSGAHLVRYNNPGNTSTIWGYSTSEGTALAANTPRVWSFSVDASNVIAGRSRLGAIGSQTQTLATASTIAVQAFAIGAGAGGTSWFTAATLGEIILCSAALTVEQIRRIELYLAGYYGLI